MRLAFYQPDIPQNLGAAVRLAACLDVELHVIEPCGFPLDMKRLKQSALDYFEHCTLVRHASWDAFLAQTTGRLILFSTKATQDYTQFQFHPDDTLLMGRESAGVPEEVVKAVDTRVKIPLNPAARSLNVVMAAAIALGEGLRQTR